MADDLSTLKDDMVAFIEGHGLKRFFGYISTDEVQCVVWNSGENPDGWKDFVELAKSAGAAFLIMHTWTLERKGLDDLSERLRNAHYTSDEDIEEVRWLRTYAGKTGFVQLGWAHQGTIFLYEASTPWYDNYQHLLELSEDFSGLTLDEPDQEDER
jgi:hypothetical protein